MTTASPIGHSSGAVSPAERALLLGALAGRRVDYPTDATVLELFQRQAAAAPDRPALTFEDETLSYGVLNDKANALAFILAEEGVRRGDLIPLVLDNGLELPLAMIALMKLGAPFVPIDRGWPEDRLRRLFAALAPRLILTDADGRSRLADLATGVAVSTVAQDRLSPDPAVPGPGPVLNDLIYGFFTSGSTGLPKCALNRHHGLLNRFLYMTRRFGAQADDVILQNSKHVFDSSIWQLLWPLTKGARVVIPRPAGLLDLDTTIDTIERHGVTMTDFVPSIFNALVTLIADDPVTTARLRSLRQLLIGGEEINVRAVQTFRRLLPGVGITNTFGPTECSIGSVFHEVTDADVDSIPIGRPIDNTYVVILDENGHPVPQGTIGELHIGGDCVGAGYLQDPEKTAAAFIVNPFPEIPGDRLYRTGDLGHHRADGKLVFIGRRDNQVKVGGVRIELGEVEGALLSHPAVREAKALVVAHGDHRMLVACVVVASEVAVSDIRSHVEAFLPRQAVPRRIVRLEAMPLTPNGKTDRKALSAIVMTADGEVPVPQAAVDGHEAVMAAIWKTWLGVAAIGPDDDFFDLGGDSLVALNIMLDIERRFGVRLPVTDIFSHPRISRLVAHVRSAMGEGGAQEASNRHRAPDRPVLELEIRLADDIRPDAAGPPGPPATILLTGATGFVGAHILHDLLRTEIETVFCLVRAADDARARRRIVDTLAAYDLPISDADPRIVVLKGDLEQPDLGLAPGIRDHLAASLDAIVHAGAMVNFLHDYRRHRTANVDGTAALLRLAARGRPKRFVHLSTLSVFPLGDGPPDGGIAETATPLDGTGIDGGYNQSKWVAERLASAARERGLFVDICRLGEIMPHARTGIANPTALSDLILRGCLILGLRPPMPWAFDYTPVDFIGRAVAALLCRPDAVPQTFHLLDAARTSFDTVLDGFAAAGFPLRPVGYPEFFAALEAACRHPGQADRDLASLLSLLPAPMPTDPAMPSVFVDNGRYFTQNATAKMLEILGVEVPCGAASVGIYATRHRRARPSHRTDALSVSAV